MDDQTKKVVGFVIGAIGLISSVIGIYVFVSGRQNLGEALSQQDTGSQPARVTTESEQVDNESWPDPTHPLVTGNATFTLEWANVDPVGYSFEQGAFAASSVPADIGIRSCKYRSGSGYCDIQAGRIWELGQVPLSQVDSVKDQKPGCSQRYPFAGNSICLVDLGQTYVVETYNGHLAKFRIANYQLLESSSFEITFEWVYQPNERPDFASP